MAFIPKNLIDWSFYTGKSKDGNFGDPKNTQVAASAKDDDLFFHLANQATTVTDTEFDSKLWDFYNEETNTWELPAKTIYHLKMAASILVSNAYDTGADFDDVEKREVDVDIGGATTKKSVYDPQHMHEQITEGVRLHWALSKFYLIIKNPNYVIQVSPSEYVLKETYNKDKQAQQEINKNLNAAITFNGSDEYTPSDLTFTQDIQNIGETFLWSSKTISDFIGQLSTQGGYLTEDNLDEALEPYDYIDVTELANETDKARDREADIIREAQIRENNIYNSIGTKAPSVHTHSDYYTVASANADKNENDLDHIKYEEAIELGKIEIDKIWATLSITDQISYVTNTDLDTTTATITYHVSKGNANNTGKVDYRVNAGSWVETRATTTTAGDYEINLTSLTPDTSYTVDLQIDGVFDTADTTTFRTIQDIVLGTISAVSASNVAKTSATINYTYTAGQNVANLVQYRINGGAWTTTTASPINLSALTHSTQYTVEFQVDGVLQIDADDKVTFTTLAKEYALITDNSITISNVDYDEVNVSYSLELKDETQAIVKYSIDNGATWLDYTGNTYTTGGSKTFALTGLSGSTSYTIQLKVNDRYDGNDYKNFTTETFVVANVTSLTAESITTTTATLTYALTMNDDTSADVEYSIDNGATWLDDAVRTANGTYNINLTGLNPNTTYYCDIRVNGIKSAREVNFSTLDIVGYLSMTLDNEEDADGSALWIRNGYNLLGSDNKDEIFTFNEKCTTNQCSSSDEIIIKKQGRYKITWNISGFNNSGTGGAQFSFSINSLNTIISNDNPNGNYTIEREFDFNVNDKLTFLLKITNGSTGYMSINPTSYKIEKI